MALLKKTAPFVVPTIDETDRTYAELEATEGRLREQERVAQRLVDDIRRNRVHTGPQVRSDRIAELAGDDPSAAPLMSKPVPDAAEAARDLVEIQIALSRVVERKKAARESASATICERANPHVVAHMMALAKALAAAHAAHLEITRITDELDDADVSWVGRFPHAPAHSLLGDPRVDQSKLAFWFAEAVSEGAIKHSDVPEALR